MAGNRKRRRDSGGFNVWRSYSDMMAGLLMLFILIMCVTLFQAQKNYVERLAEQAEKMRIQKEYNSELLEKQSELDAQAEQLASQNDLLAQQKAKLEEQGLTLDEMQAALEAQALLLDEKTATLARQQQTLEQQQSALESKQAELNAATNDLNAATQELDSKTQELNSKTQELKEKQAQIDRIVGVKAEVIEALRQEFAANNVNVDIDRQSGALVLDSNVMFAYDDVELSQEGQQVLAQVLPIYCEVLLDDRYKDNVAEIIIDGYTDTDGSYEYNLQLSQQRSLAVAQYLLQIENSFLDGSGSERLRDILTVNGHSMSDPVYDEYGNIDMDASRRVEVKFRLRDEEMIEELRQLVE